MNREEARLHAYLDGELDPAAREELERALAASRERTVAFAALRELDGALRRSLAPLASRFDRLAPRVWRPPRPVRRPFLRPPLLQAAALLAVFLLGGFLGWFLTGESPPAGPDLQAELARLRAQLARLRRRAEAPLPAVRRWAPPLPEPAAPRTSPPQSRPAPLSPSRGPEAKKEVLAAIRDFLVTAARTGRWDARRARELLHRLGHLENLGADEFRFLRELFFRQPPHTMAQLYVAQAISRYFLHEPEARRFVYDQIRGELARMARDPDYLGDRALRRAWTEGLVHNYDTENVALLEQLGRLEQDWLNRRNVLGGLAAVGTPAAAVALARLAVAERNPVLRYEGLLQLRDLVYVDPTVGAAARRELEGLLKRIVLGPFGEQGANWDAMVWAFQILDLLGVPTDGLRRQWMDRNRRVKGGDIRGGTPGGIPGSETR